MDAFLLRCYGSLGARLAEVPALAGMPPPAADGQLLAAGEVRAVRFPLGLRGYDLAEVDALLRRVASLLPEEPAGPSWDGEPVVPVLGPGPGLRTSLRGYRCADVDVFLVRCAHSLGADVGQVPELAALTGRLRTGHRLRPGEVEGVKFAMVWRGYAVDRVDALLDRVQAALPR